MIPKGSVAVDGVSLTINACTDDGFEVSIIPHTLTETDHGNLKKSRWEIAVNIETDMIGKYVERLLTGPRDSPVSSRRPKPVSGDRHRTF